LAGILATGRAPAYAQGQKLHIVRWVDFVPAGDEVLRKQMPEASKALGAEVNLETINANDLQPRITAAISSGSGADIFHILHNWAHLYEKSLADVGDVVDAIGKSQGGYYPAAEAACKVGATWRAAPHVVVGGRIAHRKSLFEEIGLKEFPKTWQAYREAGKKLKAKGYPFGQTAGHTFGDAPSFWYSYLWSWGGKEVEQDGKTVAINTKETVEAVKFAVALWKDAMDEGGLAWDDTNNNRAFLSGTISATNNGASIYIESLRNKEKYKTDKGALMHTDIAHAPNPAGPAGVFEYHASFHHGIMSYSKNQKLAKDFLRWLHGKEQFEPWFVAEKGLRPGARQGVGRARHVAAGPGDAALQGGGQERPLLRLRRPAERQGLGSILEIRRRRPLRQGDPGHAGRGLREVGRGRAEEDLRVDSSYRSGRGEADRGRARRGRRSHGSPCRRHPGLSSRWFPSLNKPTSSRSWTARRRNRPACAGEKLHRPSVEIA
jgi:multiple sugar transport system substrate-binding protein